METRVKEQEKSVVSHSIETDAGFLVDSIRVAEIHAPELYRHTVGVKPLNGFGAIDDEAIASYREWGFLAIENAFTPVEIAAAKDGLGHLVMGGRPDFRDIQFEQEAADKLPTMTLDERLDAVRKLMYFTPYDERLRAIAEHPALVALVGRLLDATPEMFQDMALLKPPHIGREKPWHQDLAYFDLPVGSRVAGAWIALDEATIENGCMHVLPGGHIIGPRPHFNRRDWQICDTEIMGQPCSAIPLKPGGLLLFDALLPHGTPVNHSGQRRRALQFHYAPKDVAHTSTEERMAAFGSEGRDVSC